ALLTKTHQVGLPQDEADRAEKSARSNRRNRDHFAGTTAQRHDGNDRMECVIATLDGEILQRQGTDPAAVPGDAEEKRFDRAPVRVLARAHDDPATSA